MSGGRRRGAYGAECRGGPTRYSVCRCFFFFQAEDGIRDYKVTGVQTCALPISLTIAASLAEDGADLVLVDYLTLLSTSSGKSSLEGWSEAATISAELKEVARRLDRKSVV